MTDNKDNVTLELIFAQNRKTHDELAKIREWQALADDRFKAIEHHAAGTYYASRAHSDEVSMLRKRLARLEERLGLSDNPEH